jgi:hypothetical protein
MGTTAQQDAAFYDTLIGKFAIKPVKRGGGGVVFAGNLWPALTVTTQPPTLVNGTVPPPVTRPNPGAAFKRKDAQTALEQARAMIIPAYIAAKGAVNGSSDTAIATMERWFGPRPVAPMTQYQRDWWVGVVTILGVIESFLTGDVNLYYRGPEAQGRPTDYPGEVGNLTAQDVSGYAETAAGDGNSIIGLCKLFFAKQVGTGQSRMKLRGYDSVGGTLVHELSHNLCETDDHEMPDGSTAYGTPDCLILKAALPRRAWYNADNIEYFCEEVLYGTGTTAPVTTGAVTGVGGLRAIFGS